MRESDISAAIVQHYRNRGAMVVKMHPGPLGAPPGFPDLMVLAPGGKVRFIEVKAAKGKLTPLQQHTITALQNLGFSAVVARSVSETLGQETT